MITPIGYASPHSLVRLKERSEAAISAIETSEYSMALYLEADIDPGPAAKAVEAPKRHDPRDLDMEVARYLIQRFTTERDYGRAELQAAMQALGIWHYETENLLRAEVRLDQRFGVKS